MYGSFFMKSYGMLNNAVQVLCVQTRALRMNTELKIRGHKECNLSSVTDHFHIRFV